MEDRPPYEQFRDQFRAWTQHVMTAGSTGFHESRSKEVKLFVGDDHYVEYWPFREISIERGEAVEFEVPAFIADLAR